MLGKWTSQKEYQEYVMNSLRDISQKDAQKVLEY